jgi:riboflavin kinase/FMN adenylyltransferase
LAIGNFDGVHRGHQALLARVRAAAERLGAVPAVLTFEPHTRHYFAQLKGQPEAAPPMIATMRNKLQALAAAGIEHVTIMRFDATFAGIDPARFVEDILVRGLNVKALVVGENFTYGSRRSGDIASLVEAGARYGFEVDVLPTVRDDGGRVSSSAIREALREADFARAAELLGKPFTVSGHVIHGDQRGRGLGFPTANLRIRLTNPALTGVFVTRVHGLEEQPLPSVSNLGTRPTVEDSTRFLLETHMLDYGQDCYGKLIHVEFLHKLRDNRKFPDLPALSQAITSDVADARAYFARHHSDRHLPCKDRI